MRFPNGQYNRQKELQVRGEPSLVTIEVCPDEVQRGDVAINITPSEVEHFRPTWFTLPRPPHFPPGTSRLRILLSFEMVYMTSLRMIYLHPANKRAPS